MPSQPHQVGKIPASLLSSGVVQELRFNQTMIGDRHALMIRCGLTMANSSLSRRECLALAGAAASLAGAAALTAQPAPHPSPDQDRERRLRWWHEARFR